MVESPDGRVRLEVPRSTLYCHADLEIVLRGFDAAYNGRRQRVLNEVSPEIVLRQRFDADPALAIGSTRPGTPLDGEFEQGCVDEVGEPEHQVERKVND